MNLFASDPFINLLPRDGTVNYHGPVLNAEEAGRYQQILLDNVPWKSDGTVIFGRHIVTARKVAWYGDSNYLYAYSGTTKHALVWTPALRELKALVEQFSKATFNSCLLNLYHHGDEGMGWHSDDEKSLVKDAAIASLSFGAERKFCFKHKQTEDRTSLILEHGSLLVMRGSTQSHWLHSLPKSKKILQSRINLTFRTIVCE